MNSFGGSWTENKIEILVEYAKAYLRIMNVHARNYGWKLLYFDGFAGSGLIEKEDQRMIIGAAVRILQISEPRSFDTFYFVEKKIANAGLLKANTKDKFPEKDIHVVEGDGNDKILAMGNYLANEGKVYRTLAYIDPCGMQVNWASLQALEKRSVDVWILIPTGMGVNRLLKRSGEISDAWLERLQTFLGMEKEDILGHFYKERVVHTLFGEEIAVSKEEKAIEKSAALYSERLGKLFNFVSEPYILKNTANATMFHFLMVSNNQKAVNIANDIVKKYNRK